MIVHNNGNNHGDGNNGNGYNKMLTSRELAEKLNVHINTIRRWSDNGLILTYRVGPRGDRRYHWHDVEQFLKQGHDLYEKVR